MRKLALGNPELCAWSGGIKLIIESITNSYLEDISDSLVYTLLYLINEPTYRNKISGYLNLSRIFSLFTDIDLPTDNPKDKQKFDMQKFENELKLAKKAIITMLKSWPGLIYLGNESIGIKSLIQALKQPIKPIISKTIFEILGELFSKGTRSPPINGARPSLCAAASPPPLGRALLLRGWRV